MILIRVLGDAFRRAWRRFLPRASVPGHFAGSAAYWETRYSGGGHSGAGSYGPLAEFKAEVLNEFVATQDVQTVIELGCGDGNQLSLARYPAYLGFDVSATAVVKCRERFASDASRSFRLMSEYSGERADLALSLDVVYHLVEDDVFERYMRTLFGAATRYVCIYSSDTGDRHEHQASHMKHRPFTAWVRSHMRDWKLVKHLPNRHPYRGDPRTGSLAEFFFYAKS